MSEMGVHIPESYDFVAQVAFSGASSVHQFMGGEARENYLGVMEIWVRFPFLWHEEMTKLAKNQFSWAFCRAVLSESR